MKRKCVSAIETQHSFDVTGVKYVNNASLEGGSGMTRDDITAFIYSMV